MRYDLIDSLLLGGTIGFVALALHMLTDGAPPHYQLLALVLAGAALFAVQIALALRRSRQSGRGSDEAAEHEPPRLRHNRRNPFYRELTSDWTGLDEYPPAPERPAPRPDTGSSGDRSVNGHGQEERKIGDRS
jgi:hypothetical protein